MKLSIKLLLIVLGLVLVMTSHAQSTEQSENECFEGGMLEGQCSNTDVDGDGIVDQEDINWMFECGYYLALVDNGEILNDEVPLDGCTKQERVIPRPHKVKEKTVCKRAPASPLQSPLRATTVKCVAD
jgi:hypothetical protein